MNWHNLLQLVGTQGWFDFASLVILSGEDREQLRTQVHRWCVAGKLIPLRRGLYTFGEAYRKREVNLPGMANSLYGPSYLSLHWALNYHGLIPEAVHEWTSVTSRPTKTFENAFGRFTYRHVKQERFWGYRQMKIGNGTVLLASPEKALLDLWYLEPGEWTRERMMEMRFQNFEGVDVEALQLAAERFDSRKVDFAVRSWERVRESELEGTVLL